MAEHSGYISTAGRRMTAPSNSRSRGPITPIESDQSDEFFKIQQKAQAASKFYSTVGLSNGDLPRNSSSRSNVNRRSVGSPDLPQGYLNSKKTTTTPLTTPLVTSPSKYGMWIKPRNKSEDSTLSLTLKSSKALAQNQSVNSLKSRSKSSSSNDTFVSMDGVSPTSENFGHIEFNVSTRPDELYIRSNNSSCYTSTADPLKYKSASLNRPSHGNFEIHNGSMQPIGKTNKTDAYQTSSITLGQKDPLGKNKQIIYATTLPIPKNMHSVSPPIDINNKSFTSGTKNCSYDSIANSSADDKKKSIKTSQLTKNDSKHSHNDSWTNLPDVATEILSASYDGAIDNKSLPESRAYGSVSSLNNVNDKEIEEIIQGYRQNRHHTDQERTVNIKKVNSDQSSPSIKNHRRFNKDKIRSKSDVPDHKILLNKIPGIYNEDMEEVDGFKRPEFDDDRKRRHHFAHHDWQSMLFSFKDVLLAMDVLKRKNTTTGASKASALVAAISTESLTRGGSSLDGSIEDLSFFEDEGLSSTGYNDLVQLCPYFRNEIGGEREQVVCISSSGTNTSHHSTVSVQLGKDGDIIQARNVITNQTYLSVCECSNNKSALPPGSPPSGSVTFGIEHVDDGAFYYRNYFYEKDHQNYCGVDDRYGPIVLSLRREKVEDEGVGAYQHRVILRTSELCTLRGLVLDDAIQMGTKHGSKNQVSSKEVIEYICPEINLGCFKVAPNTPKFQEQLMKVDEQNVFKKYKIGVLYCKADQITEEDMYNNEVGSPAFSEFLEILGKKVKLLNFPDFRGGLDVKTDSTGTESYFTTFKDYKIMFHVSTMLPFTPNNRQQLLRKRHIGNDIATVVFQEPGSKPFTPKHIRSHFQHVFIVVRVVNDKETNKTYYRVSVARERNIPKFGPAIPENSMFPKSSIFREFLLTKIINGENVAHAAGKFKSMAMNTRQEYLRDIAKNQVTQVGLEGNPKFGRFSISAASRRIRENKEKQKAKPTIFNHGALTWQVSVDDYSSSGLVQCIMGISHCVLTLVDIGLRQLIFSIPCQAVIGWTVPISLGSCRDLHIYYGRGERLTIHSEEIDTREEIVLRLEKFTKGCETIYRQLRRNPKGELGFHVNYEGIVMEVEVNGYAALDGLKQSSRLVEICKVAVATMSHEEIIDLLRTSERVKVVLIPPNEDMTPRKCSMELYHLYPVLEVKKVKPCFIEHERSQSEPVKVNLVERPALFSTQSNLETISKKNINPIYHTGSLDKKRHKTNNLANQLSYHRNSSNQSTSKSTVSSSFSSPGNFDDNQSKATVNILDQRLSSDNGLNSNNNSSNTSSRTFANSPAVQSVSQGRNQRSLLVGDMWTTPVSGPLLQQNQNNNNSLRQYKVRRSVKEVDFNPKTVPNTETHGKLENIHSITSSTLCEPPRAKPRLRFQPNTYGSTVDASIQWHPASFLPNKQNFSKTSKSKHRGDMGTRIKKTNYMSPIATPTSSDVQNSLIRLLTNDSRQTKQPVAKKRSTRLNRSPNRSASQQKSSKLRPSPIHVNRVRSPLSHPIYRTMSDESLCGAKSNDVILARQSSANKLDHNFYDAPSPIHHSYCTSPNAIPLPVEDSSWDRILDAANAAESFEATAIKSLSIGNINEIDELNSYEHSNGLGRTPNITMKQLYDQESPIDNDYVSNHLLRKQDPPPLVTSQKSQSSSSRHNESEQRLERIERELTLLQEKLQKERESKKYLQEEVLTLRKDNTRLQHHMKTHDAFPNH